MFGNWEWSNIFTAYSGQPVNVILDSDNANIGASGGEPPNLLSNLFPLARAGSFGSMRGTFAIREPFTFDNAGRNITRGPGLINWDMNVNLVHFDRPVSTLENPSFGVITTARSTRDAQLSLKITFEV